MTWAQVWTVASNAAIRALDPLLSAINWVANNIQTVVPHCDFSREPRFGVLLIAANWTNILAFASEKAAAAQAFLNAVMAANPAALAAAAVLVLVAGPVCRCCCDEPLCRHKRFRYRYHYGRICCDGCIRVQQCSGSPAEWNLPCLQTLWAMCSRNPVAAVKVLFYDMAITVLQYMQNIASAVEGLINMIPGVTVDLTSGLGGWITDLAEKTEQ